MTTQKNIYETAVSTDFNRRKFYSLFMMNTLLLFLLPLSSIIAEIHFEHSVFSWVLIGKWFIFWAIGIRLFTTGISQSSNPAFIAKIWQQRSLESLVLIRELGFSNISLGVMGILSVLNDSWRILAAITGCLFFGLAGIKHLFKKSFGKYEQIAMSADLFVFIVMVLYLIFTTLYSEQLPVSLKFQAPVRTLSNL